MAEFAGKKAGGKKGGAAAEVLLYNDIIKYKFNFKKNFNQ